MRVYTDRAARRYGHYSHPCRDTLSGVRPSSRDAAAGCPAVVFVWDQDKDPSCADTTAGHTGPLRTAFPVEQDTTHTHYPFRHSDRFLGLRYDGGSKVRKPSSLTARDCLGDVNP